MGALGVDAGPVGADEPPPVTGPLAPGAGDEETAPGGDDEPAVAALDVPAAEDDEAGADANAGDDDPMLGVWAETVGVEPAVLGVEGEEAPPEAEPAAAADATLEAWAGLEAVDDPAVTGASEPGAVALPTDPLDGTEPPAGGLVGADEPPPVTGPLAPGAGDEETAPGGEDEPECVAAGVCDVGTVPTWVAAWAFTDAGGASCVADVSAPMPYEGTAGAARAAGAGTGMTTGEAEGDKRCPYPTTLPETLAMEALPPA